MQTQASRVNDLTRAPHFPLKLRRNLPIVFRRACLERPAAPVRMRGAVLCGDVQWHQPNSLGGTQTRYFGLHSGALAVKKRGGALRATSDDPELGASFALGPALDRG